MAGADNLKWPKATGLSNATLRRRFSMPMLVVEDFNNGRRAMATMNFSIPEDVKDKFNEVFEGKNKSAVITKLMVRAIEEEERNRRSLGFVERLRLIRARSRVVADEEVNRAREKLRE